MIVDGKHYRTVREKEGDPSVIEIIDQRQLPHRFVITGLRHTDDFVTAIKEMYVRGAPLIGAVSAYGMYISALKAPQEKFDEAIAEAAQKLIAARPTAVNLSWAVNRVVDEMNKYAVRADKTDAALKKAREITENDVNQCKKIGEYGYGLLWDISQRKGGSTVNILTHCNAGWLATVDYGTATAPIYEAFSRGLDIHVWVDETRPRNQGARLTAWELGKHGVKHTVIVDNAGGHLMQHGMVDVVIVGSDRTTITGDVANKIGTYLKALAAKDNGVPFYAALPSSTIDPEIEDGVKDIPIEERDSREVKYVEGLTGGDPGSVLIMPASSPAANYAFDVTPARLVTGIITERGITNADKDSMLELFPEFR